MASPVQKTAIDNFNRFNRLLLDIGTSVLRRMLEVKASQQAADVDALLRIARVKLKLQRLCPKIIDQYQFDLLYPKSGQNWLPVDISKWDITLLSCVLTNVGRLSQQENDKVKEIREARNQLYGHVVKASMDTGDYTTQWKNLVDIIKELLTFCNDASFAQKTNDFINFVKADVYQEKVKRWTDDDIKFVKTRASERIKELVENENSVTISGHSGGGKSAIAHHVALCYESQGYTILPVSRADEIKQLSNLTEKQLFVIDDPVGKNRLHQQEVELFKQYHNDLKTLLKAGTKMIFTCRPHICKDKQFKIRATVIGQTVIDLYDDVNRLNEDEKRAILKKHLNVSRLSAAQEGIAKKQYSNYPFLCRMFASKPSYLSRGIEFFDKPIDLFRQELDGLSKTKYCALVTCVMFTDEVEAAMFDPFHARYNETEHKVKQIMKACGIKTTFERANLLEEIESLVGTFLIKEGPNFIFLHDILYDVTALHFGNRYPCVVLEHASSNFIRDYVRVERDEADINHVVLIEEDNFPILAKRLVADITNGFFFDVFLNPIFMNTNVQNAMQQCVRNMTQSEVYHMAIKSKQKLIAKQSIREHVKKDSYLSKHVITLRELYSVDEGVLHWLLAFGHIDLFSMILEKLSIPDEEWRESPSTKDLLAFACLSGNVEIVKTVYDKGDYENIAMAHENNNVMHMTVLSGNPNVARYISERKPKISLVSNLGLTPLHLLGLSDTMHGEDVKDMVSIILDLGVDINASDKKGHTPLFRATAERHIDAVRVLLDMGANVNHCNKDDISSLYEASFDGFADVVRVLIDKGGNVNQCDKNDVSPLYVASEKGHVNVVRVLLDKDANINQCNKDDVSPLYIASQNGHDKVVRVLLEKGGNVNECNTEGISSLLIASQQGHVDVVREVLDKGGDVHQCDKVGASPLYTASRCGHVDVVRVLCENDGNVNQCSDDGISPLFIASEEGHADVVSLLLDKGGAINQCDKRDISPLCIASQQGHVDVIRVLLDKGGNVNLGNKDNIYPIHIASAYGHCDVVRMLLENGGDVNQCGANGLFPLYIASMNGHIRLVRLLLDRNGNVNQLTHDGVSPLYIASQKGYIDIVRMLVEKGGNVNQCNKNGVFPLYIASQNGHVNVVRVLLNKGGDTSINQCNKEGISSLYVASHQGHVDVVRVLLEKNGNVNQCDTEGASPLWIASDQGHVDVVQVLLKKDRNVNQCDEDGRTPLWIASRNGHANVAGVLLDKGGDFTQCNKHGESPLYIASEKNHVSVVRVLLEKGADVNQCNPDGVSPLAIAAHQGHVNVVHVLLNNGGDVNQCEKSGASPLWLASHQGRVDVVRVLLNKGGNVKQCNTNGESPLLIATNQGHDDVVRLLSDNVGDVNQCD